MLSFILNGLINEENTGEYSLEKMLGMGTVSKSIASNKAIEIKKSVKKYYAAKKAEATDETADLRNELIALRLEKETIDQTRSVTFQAVYTLLIAAIYEDIDYFHIPVFYDFRGRVYCGSKYLHYQGNELSKSLLVGVDIRCSRRDHIL